MFYNHDMSWWGYAGMGIGMTVFGASVLFGIVVLVAYVCRDRTLSAPPPHCTTAEEILAARLARGEIDETEYRHRIAVLHDR